MGGAVRTELGILLSTRRVWLCSSLGATIWMGLATTLNSPPVRSWHSVSSSASNVSCVVEGKGEGVGKLGG